MPLYLQQVPIMLGLLGLAHDQGALPVPKTTAAAEVVAYPVASLLPALVPCCSWCLP